MSLLRSSLSVFGLILASHGPLFHIDIVPEYFLVQPMFDDGHQIGCLPPLNQWTYRGGQQDDCVYPENVQIQTSSHLE